jgi:hypothetical protein
MTLIFCFALCLAGFGYVWHRNRNEQLERQIKLKHARLDELRALRQSRQRQIEFLRSHRAIEARVKELGLPLGLPRPERILRLPLTGVSVASAPHRREALLAGSGQP